MTGRVSRAVHALRWLAPIACVALAVAGERIIVLHPERFAVLPRVSDRETWLRLQMQHIDEKLVGYALMLIAAAAFTFTLRAGAKPAREVTRPHGDSDAPLLPWLPSMPEIVALAVAALVWAYGLYSVYERERDLRTPAMLLLTLIVLAIVLVRRDVSARVRFAIGIARWEAAALVAITIVAAVVLSWDLQGTPRGIWGDEGSFWEAAISHKPVDVLRDPFRPGVYGFPFASTLPPSVASSWFGHNVVAWRASSVAFAVAIVPGVYFLARHLFGRTAGFAACGILMSSPYLLAFGRMGYNSAQALLPVVLAATLAAAALQRRSAALFFAAGAAAGLGFYTYSAGRLAPMLIGVLLIHAGLVRRLTWREAGFALALAALGTIMVGFPPFLGALVDPAPDARRKMIESLFLNEAYVRSVFPDKPVEAFSRFTWQGVPFLFDPMITLRLVLRGLVRTLLAFHDDELVKFHFIRGPLAGRWTSALLLPGVALGLMRWRSSAHVMVVAWTVLALVLLSVVNAEPPHQAHMVVIIPSLAIWIGATIGVLADRLRDVRWRIAPSVATGAAALVVTVLAVIGVREYRSSASSFLPHAEMAVWWEAMEMDDDEYVVWVHYEQHYLDSIPLGIRMFELGDHYDYVPVDEMLTTEGQRALAGASVVVVGARRVSQAEGRDFPYEVARVALPGWRVEPLYSADQLMGWIFRPPVET